MTTNKHINTVCILATVAALVITLLFMNGQVLGIQARTPAMTYADRLFDTSRVHTIDIIIDDWEGFLSTAQSEEYTVCDVVIDGEAFRTVGIRGKGNTSLSTVASMDSDRYSFKLEFDQYDSGGSYYGLDKLSLNNLIQDNTMMKDYLTYRMMNEFGAAAPLCSYVYITVNGEDWGLYLAVEAVEESFLQRNYGTGYGDLYKPDNMDMGGGRGNGKDFDISQFQSQQETSESATEPEQAQIPEGFGGGRGGRIPGGMGNFDPSQQDGFDPAQQGNFDPSQQGGRGFGGGMSSGTTKLQYVDDAPSSYSAIFDSAKTDVTTADQNRLIAALKTLSQGSDPAQAVDAEAVLRYFVVHNFVVNGDSYTGSMVHNYYLYEQGGRLSMIPWDYNLAYGTFMGGSADQSVNDDIDSPLSVTGADRPMIDWIYASEEYTQLYHQYFREFLDTVDAQAIIQQAKALISPYVEKDPTRFCTYEEFETGVKTLSAFCDLRSQSVTAQLEGTAANIDTSALNLSDMGSMGGEKMPTRQESAEPSAEQETQAQPQGMEPGQMPDFQGGFPGAERSPQQGGFPGAEQPVQQENIPAREQSQSQSGWVLPLVSVAVLAAGLWIAFKFR